MSDKPATFTLPVGVSPGDVLFCNDQRAVIQDDGTVGPWEEVYETRDREEEAMLVVNAMWQQKISPERAVAELRSIGRGQGHTLGEREWPA
jgi:hypothetical protein